MMVPLHLVPLELGPLFKPRFALNHSTDIKGVAVAVLNRGRAEPKFRAAQSWGGNIKPQSHRGDSSMYGL